MNTEKSIINLGIIAHVDTGKTTTTERMLYLCGKIKTPGSIKNGDTMTDYLPIERQRGISVRAASVSFEYGGVTINLIDTPGHTDFAGEVERSLSILDGAVIIVSAAEGVQPQTEQYWAAIKALKIPAVIYINKIDRAGCEPLTVLSDIREKLTGAAIPLNAPVNPGSKECTIVPCAIDEDGLLALAEHDETLAEYILEEKPLPEHTALSSLKVQASNALAYPLIHGASQISVGVKELLDTIIAYIPAARRDGDKPLSGLVYRVQHDKSLGKVAHVRLYQGTVANRDMVTVNRSGTEPFTEKVTLVKRASGLRFDDIGVASGGEVAVLCGLQGVKAGDVLGEVLFKRGLSIAQPLFSVKVLFDEVRLTETLNAVRELTDEDPLLGSYWEPGERELVVRIMGGIQTEVLSMQLKERYGLDCAFSAPSVIYKETPAGTGVGFESYTMPKPCWAILELVIEPLPPGSGVVFNSTAPVRRIAPRYQNHVETSVYETLKQGIYGWDVTDIKVTLTDGENHKFHTHPMDFFLATPIAVMRGLTNAGSTLLEPMINASLSFPEDALNRVIGDVLDMRGEFESPSIKAGQVDMRCLLPVSTSMEYPIRLASLTSGKGRMATRFSGYRPCPIELGATTKRRGINPLDRAKWILYKRDALRE